MKNSQFIFTDFTGANISNTIMDCYDDELSL